MALGGRNHDFHNFVVIFVRLKVEDVLERHANQKKVVQVINHSPFEGLAECAGYRERKREGFRSLLGQKSGKKI